MLLEENRFSIRVDRKRRTGVYRNLAAGEHMNSAKVRMFPKKCERKCKKQTGCSETRNDKDIQQTVVRLCVRAEIKATTFTGMVHHRGEPSPGRRGNARHPDRSGRYRER